jgi:hypothetical protein
VSNKLRRCGVAPTVVREQIAIEIMSVYLFGIWSDGLFRPQIDAASAMRSANALL